MLTGLCEPFLAPDRVFYVADKMEALGGAFAIYTNGSLMNEEIIRRLLGYKGFKFIHISLNAFTDATRKKVMNLDLAKAENNLVDLLKLRKEYGREEDVNVGTVYMLTPTNRPEETAFRNKWVSIFAQYPNCSAPGIFMTTNWNGDANMPWLRSSGLKFCNQWNSLYPGINVDGDIYLCYYAANITFGSCLDSDAVDRWVGRKVHYGVSSTDIKPPPAELCGSCSGWKNVNWTR